MVVYIPPGLEKRIYEAEKTLSSELERYKGMWVIIDIQDKKIFYTSYSKQEVIELLMKLRRGEDLYLTHVGEPTIVNF